MTTTEMLTRGDSLVERGASFLEQVARDFSRDGGTKAKLADELAEDAQFLRRLKPTLIAARIRGEAPTDQERGTPRAGLVALPRRPEQPRAARAPRKREGGPNPFAVVGAALVAGIVLAKFIDWRGHAHPRR